MNGVKILEYVYQSNAMWELVDKSKFKDMPYFGKSTTGILVFNIMVKKYGIEILGYESCNMKRRKFIKDTSFLIGGLSLPFVGSSFLSGCSNQPAFKISLAEWSLHLSLIHI